MKELLNKFCFSEKENGLLLIDMPTGTGKTHSTIDFIYSNYKKLNKKIIFITNLKKNLPIDKLKSMFVKDGKGDNYDSDVLFLDNNVDCLIENFDKIKNDIPYAIFNKNNIIENIKRNVTIINNLKKSINEAKEKKISFIDINDNNYYIIKQSRDELTDKYEKEFRNIIEEALSYNDNKKKRTKAEKLELIKNDNNYNWIGKLYPSVYTDEKKIIFMSIDKFLVRNSTIIEPSYNIIDNVSLLKNSIIFIDEFDASKDIFLKSIISDSEGNQIGIIELFRVILSGLFNTEFSKLLTEKSQNLHKKITEHNNKIYLPLEIIEEFRMSAIEIMKNYNLKNYHKLVEEDKEKANFLFQDYKFHTILNDEKKQICIKRDESNNINWIKSLKDIDIDLPKNENIFNLLHDIKAFISYFQNGIRFIADNYIALKKERKQEINNFSYEAAIKTVLSEFGIEGKYLNYLTFQIMSNKKKKVSKIVDLKSELDTSVYEKGFRLYNFLDSDTFDTQSKINYLSFNLSPEKILIYLCNTTKVIGISATGTLNTVTGNYDLEYVRSKIGDSYYIIAEEDKTRIEKEITKKLGNYKDVKIVINRCDITENNFQDTLKEIFVVSNDINYINDWFDSHNLTNYQRSRYVKLFYAINLFSKNKISSYLFLGNVTIKHASYDFNYSFISEIFTKITNKNNFSASLYPLDGTLEKFENTKNNIQKKLKKGENVFVVSTYQTLGAGQNLQYEYDSDTIENIVEVTNNPYGKNQKDFDAIFLDKPTNLFVNMNNYIDSDQLLKFIYQVKSLEEKGEITLSESENMIKTGIKKAYHTTANKISIPRSKHIYTHTSKIIMQAIGRICRTQNKSKEISISFDTQMEKDLAIVKDELLKRHINYEFRALLENCNNVNQQYIANKNYSNINNSNSVKKFIAIENIRQFRSQSDMYKWEELRDICLRYPTAPNLIYNQYDIYCTFEKETNYYYCVKISDKEYNITDRKINSMTIGEDLARLNQLMEIPGISEYFKKKEYATCFKKSKYILLPTVFNKIYLGALGEVIGEFIVNKFLESIDTRLERIKIKDNYEKFDFVINNSIYIDFKHWIGTFDKEREEQIKKITTKLDLCGGKKAFIINILKPDDYNPKTYISKDNRVTIIPYLYDLKNQDWNNKDLLLLIKESMTLQ